MTPEQQKALVFITGYIRLHGYSPTFDEISEHQGIKSKSGAHRMIKALVAQGFLRHTPRQFRGLEIIDMAQEKPGKAIIVDTLARRIAAALMAAHAFDDGSGEPPVLIASEGEVLTVVMGVLSA